MYTKEQKEKAIELFIKYDLSYMAVFHEIEYPDFKTLKKWYKEYLKEGKFQELEHSRYTVEQKQAAVSYYMQHGKCLDRTYRAMGYPCHDLLKR